MSYDTPSAQIRREIQAQNVAGAASASMVKFGFFQAAKLKKVHALVVTAGTNASAGLDIYVGTVSVGALTIGSDVAGTMEHSALLNSAIPANGYVDIKGKANSATAVVSVILEVQVAADAAVS